MNCPVCRRSVTLGDSFPHACKHRTHYICIPDATKVDTKQCASCKGEVNLAAPLLPAIEPGSSTGIDYIEMPLKPSILSKVSHIRNYITRQTREESNDPRYLLSFGPDKCPIDWLIREKGLGLQRFLEAGITLDDFLSNGYKPADLLLFQDFKTRSGKALIALQMKPHHLRLFMDDWAKLISPQEQISIGMEFVKGSLPVKNGDLFWNAEDLVKLGWKASDLLSAGLTYVEEYKELEPTDADERALGMTQKMINELLDLHPEEPEPVQAPKPAYRIIIESEPVAPTRFYHGLKPRK